MERPIRDGTRAFKRGCAVVEPAMRRESIQSNPQRVISAYRTKSVRLPPARILQGGKVDGADGMALELRP